MGTSIEKYNILFSIILHYYGAMGRYIIRKRTAEDDGNIEKCTQKCIQNKSNYYLFFIFIIYLYYIEYYHQCLYNLLLFVFSFES